MFVFCSIFDPTTPNFSCTFPGPGKATLNAHGTVTNQTTGALFTLSAHLAGIFLQESAAGGSRFVDIVNDIKVKPAPGPRAEPEPVIPTHLGSVPGGNRGGTLIAVDEATARAVKIGDIGLRSFSDLALSPSSGRLFGSLGFGGSGAIVELDPASATVISIFGSGFDAVPALDFGPPGTPFEGTLYGVGGNPTIFNYPLITVDTTTGHGTPVGGGIGFEFVDSIVFMDDGRLFGAAFDGTRAVNDRAVLIEIDPITGVGTLVGPIGFDFIAGLEVASDGFLLRSLGGTDPLAGGLVRINPATGAGTFIGSTGFVPVSGLTKLP